MAKATNETKATATQATATQATATKATKKIDYTSLESIRNNEKTLVIPASKVNEKKSLSTRDKDIYTELESFKLFTRKNASDILVKLAKKYPSFVKQSALITEKEISKIVNYFNVCNEDISIICKYGKTGKMYLLAIDKKDLEKTGFMPVVITLAEQEKARAESKAKKEAELEAFRQSIIEETLASVLKGDLKNELKTVAREGNIKEAKTA